MFFCTLFFLSSLFLFIVERKEKKSERKAKKKKWAKRKNVFMEFITLFCSLLLTQRFCRISVIELCFSDIESNQTYQVNWKNIRGWKIIILFFQFYGYIFGRMCVLSCSTCMKMGTKYNNLLPTNWKNDKFSNNKINFMIVMVWNCLSRCICVVLQLFILKLKFLYDYNTSIKIDEDDWRWFRVQTETMNHRYEYLVLEKCTYSE